MRLHDIGGILTKLKIADVRTEEAGPPLMSLQLMRYLNFTGVRRSH